MVSKQLAALSKKGGGGGGGTPALGIDTSFAPFLSPAPSKDKKKKKDKSIRKGKTKAVPSTSTPLLPTLQPKKSKYKRAFDIFFCYYIVMYVYWVYVI